jgi:hypothetical protein
MDRYGDGSKADARSMADIERSDRRRAGCKPGRYSKTI